MIPQMFPISWLLVALGGFLLLVVFEINFCPTTLPLYSSPSKVITPTWFFKYF